MEGVEERGRTLNPRDSVLGTRVSGLIGATDFSDLGITSDSRFGFLDLKFATSGDMGSSVIGLLGLEIWEFGGDESRE